MLEPDYWYDGFPCYIDVGTWDEYGADWYECTDYLIDDYII